MDWAPYFPAFVDQSESNDPSKPKPLTQDIEVVDIGCGFGGLLVALAPLMPETLMLGESFDSEKMASCLRTLQQVY
jgi:tRNA G46 methylase TrmB